MNMPELLVPVRDETSFHAALDAGADAVYFGVGTLNMRINSKGIDLSILPRIVNAAHKKKVKVYVVLNVIVYDNEMNQLRDILKRCKDARVDAVICWDMAVITEAKKVGIPFHISTQASISNSTAATFFKELGAERVVLARECTLDQIETIVKNVNVEIEVFVHGAMCVSVSGRCFMSQHLYGHSANRGDCLQPCRRQYRITDPETGKELDVGSDGYVMSPKDLCALPILDKIVSTGVQCLKIEGRNRPAEYIKTVTAVYRQALDAIANDAFDEKLVKKLLAQLESVYNRGFSQGFLMGQPGPQDWADRYGSKATTKKMQVGRVTNYFVKRGVAEVLVTAHLPQKGDHLQIHGATTGVLDVVPDDIIYHDEKEGKRFITFPCNRVRINDQVYIIVKRQT